MNVAESLPLTLRLGPVHLTVADLERSIAWYEGSMGLRLTEREGSVAALGDGASTLVVLHEDPDAEPAGNHAKLFHYCINYPTREELARTLVRLERSGAEIANLRDRGTHEAIYLPDPDGTTIELAWDRVREDWPEDPYGHTPVPLDRDALLATVADEEPAPVMEEGGFIGHVHFTIGDVQDLVDFYSEALGFDLKYHVGNAAFFSVAGYHHQVAGNIRLGEGIDPQPQDTIGLRHWTIELADADQVAAARQRLEAGGHQTEPIEGGFAVRDPWAILVHVVS
jgi:catechol 2,3-dioxygenase